MSIEQRFNAAVNVIRGLPKNGSYQPSYEMMLRFYGYFKQATEGPNKTRRPGFWDMVGRAKYDAWKRMGELPREKAMESYVDELRKIVETMSYTENVADFYGSISELDNINFEDLELVAPSAIKKVRSQPDSPFRSRETSPGRPEDIQNRFNGNFQHSATDTSDDDEYIDTVEDEDEVPVVPVEHMTRPRDRRQNYAQQNGGIHNKKTPAMTDVTNTLIMQLTEQMKVDVQQVKNRVSLLEQQQQITRRHHNYPAWWPFQDVSPYWFSFTIVWPVAVALVFRALQHNRIRGGGGKR